MNYFEDVYLARINKYGTNLQERIYGKMEKDFNTFRAKSLNKVSFDYDGKYREGVLQSKTISEKEIMDYLLTDRSVDIAGGTIIQTKRFSSSEVQRWMVLVKEVYQVMGYNRYKVILMEKQASWIDDNLIYTSWIHQMGATGNLDARDRAILTNYKIVENNVAVDIPTKKIQLVMPNNPHCGRGTKFNLNDSTWRVSGFDKESVPGTIILTLTETYTDSDDIADERKLEGWTLKCSAGDEIISTVAGKIDQVITFYPYHYGSPAVQPITVSCEDKDLVITGQGNNSFKLFYAGDKTSFTVIAHIEGTKENIPFEVKIVEADFISLIGPTDIKVDERVEYTIKTNLSDYTVNVEVENDNLEIISIENDKIIVQGKFIGEDYIVLTYNGNEYKTKINIISFWM